MQSSKQSQATGIKSLCPAVAYDTILELAPYQTGKPVEELTREYGVSDVVKLASNENPIGCSPYVTLAITEELGQLARYPDGNGYYLKQALSDFNHIDIECITLGNGSNDLLDILARTFVAADDAIIYSQYAFVVYSMLAKMHGIQPLSLVMSPLQSMICISFIQILKTIQAILRVS